MTIGLTTTAPVLGSTDLYRDLGSANPPGRLPVEYDPTNSTAYAGGSPLSFGGALPAGGTAGQVLTKNSSTDGDASWATSSGGGGSVVPGAYNLTSSSLANAIQAWGKSDAPNQGAFHAMGLYDSNGFKPGGNNSYTKLDRILSLLNREALTFNGNAAPPRVFTFDAINFGNVPNFTAVVTRTGTWTDANRGVASKFGQTTIIITSSMTVAADAGCGVGRVYYMVQPGGGSFTLTTTSNGSFTAQSTAGALGLAYIDYRGGDGGITIAKSDATTNPVTILGFQHSRDLSGATLPGANVKADYQLAVKGSRFAVSGSKMGDFATNVDAAGSLNYLTFQKADLAYIGLFSNDINTQTPLATFSAGATALATTLKAAGTDYIFVCGFPVGSDPTNPIKATQYISAAKAVCDATNGALLDMSSYFGTFVQAALNGFADTSDGLGLHALPPAITLEAALSAKCIQAYV